MLGASLLFKQMTGRLSHRRKNSHVNGHYLNYSVPVSLGRSARSVGQLLLTPVYRRSRELGLWVKEADLLT